MKTYIINFAQAYPNFRRPELESLAAYNGVQIDLSAHNEESPFLLVQLPDDESAKRIMQRSILCKAIYEYWGHGTDLESLHKSVKETSSDKFGLYKECSFKFDIVGYKGLRSNTQKRAMIESFQYLEFEGPIKMKNPDHIFSILEEYSVKGTEKAAAPFSMWFGRQVLVSARTNNLLDFYDLKNRTYIGTTSFDAELAMISCNIAQVGPGKIAYDPFTGTGSFLVAAASFGSMPLGSDISVKALRGKSDTCNIAANFKQYGTLHLFMDLLTMDFTNNAFRKDFSIDTIVCDPPYGIREGLKVCGAKDPEKAAGRENVVIDGEMAHFRRDFIHPKKPYELADLLGDLLQFAAERLPVGGRLAFWMPTANDDFQINNIPQHQQLELVYNLEQEFNKWLRRLLVYTKREGVFGETTNGLKSNGVREFRERYFQGFNESSREGLVEKE